MNFNLNLYFFKFSDYFKMESERGLEHWQGFTFRLLEEQKKQHDREILRIFQLFSEQTKISPTPSTSTPAPSAPSLRAPSPVPISTPSKDNLTALLEVQNRRTDLYKRQLEQQRLLWSKFPVFFLNNKMTFLIKENFRRQTIKKSLLFS